MNRIVKEAGKGLLFGLGAVLAGVGGITASEVKRRRKAIDDSLNKANMIGRRNIGYDRDH